MDYGFFNMDCMEGMKNLPDKSIALAVVDPPYGDPQGGVEQVRPEVRPLQDTDRERIAGTRTARGVCRTGGTWAAKYSKKSLRGTLPPGKSIFKSFSASHGTRLYGGGNYFELPPTRCFLVWEKLTISENFSMAMAEYAWTSFNGNAKIFKYPPQGKGDRFHPTQKPVELYEWILNRYAEPGDVILDTHVGSASSLIACRNTGHKYIGYEIDPEYYRKAKARLDNAEAQMNVFDFGYME